MTLDEELARANTRITQIEKIVQRQQFIEDRYEELLHAARRCLRYDGVDSLMFNSCMGFMQSLIQQHRIEIDEMDEPND